MENTMEWLRVIAEAPGVSGFEVAVRNLLINKLNEGTELPLIE